jgi:hypothetical protein
MDALFGLSSVLNLTFQMVWILSAITYGSTTALRSGEQRTNHLSEDVMVFFKSAILSSSQSNPKV